VLPKVPSLRVNTYADKVMGARGTSPSHFPFLLARNCLPFATPIPTLAAYAPPI